ncbi:hypothetical protein CEP54_007263 [Fusarium duplospermum]|uniref:Uncharacterized protein n=1 Tax=Fusarium duplospermum TaxID=1325734 RepID=A0A428Q279_9HYPO|nr:hypothetical protein CEP54_007263 [Fusarium duplospermum]
MLQGDRRRSELPTVCWAAPGGGPLSSILAGADSWRSLIGEPLASIPEYGTILWEIIQWGCHPDNQAKFEDALHQPGGWEGWAQYEIASWINRRFYVGANFAGPQPEREVHIYQNRPRDKADIAVMDDGSMFLKEETVVVELKCESWNNPKFKDDVDKDVDKIKDAVFKLPNVRAYAVALTLSEDGEEAMRDLGCMTKLVVPRDLRNFQAPFDLWYYEREP